MPTCAECGKGVFIHQDGLFVCGECHTVLPDENELQQGFSLAQSQVSIYIKAPSQPAVQAEKIEEWNLYDAFNIILVRMTKAFQKCGVSGGTCAVVLKLWAAYLRNIKVAFLDPPKETDSKSLTENSESESEDIIPDWWQQNTVSEKIEVAHTENTEKNLPFLPVKGKNGRRKRRRRSLKEQLMSIPDDELSEKDLRKKNELIKRKYLKGVVNGENAGSTDDIDVESTSRSAGSRLWSLLDLAPEVYSAKETMSVASTMRSATELPGARSVIVDPEYLTLLKLLSFLHAALILKGSSISHADIIRWVREGHIPLYGAHQLIPSEMRLTGTDSKILGGVYGNCPVPCSQNIRQKTAKLLTLLGASEIQLPPMLKFVSRIVKDLQLPSELVSYVNALERLISRKPGKRIRKVGLCVPSLPSYAAAFLLVTLKLLIGLDGVTETKISEFAEKVNQFLKFPSSSKFAKEYLKGSESANKTLFVWDEWVRFIEYRRHILQRNHVPTAMRHGVVSEMDPTIVLKFAETEGKLWCNKKAAGVKRTAVENEILRILDSYSSKAERDQTRAILRFKPSLLPMQGLADQLLEFDPEKYYLLRQQFPQSTLEYTIDQQPVANLLQKAETPVIVKVCQGPAFKDVDLVLPYVCLSKTNNRIETKTKRAALPPSSVAVVWTASDDDNDSSQKPSVTLYTPSNAYWSRSALTETAAQDDWQYIASQLPSTFKWLLNLICEAIEERPQLVYYHVSIIESILFQKHSNNLLHTITAPLQLKKRLVALLRHDLTAPDI